MLKVAGREEEGWLRVEDIEKFPCSDLRTIDQLWIKYSDGKFGFSVQKKIYQSLGGTKEYDEKVYCSFGDKVGWRQGRKWLSELQLTFSLDTHFVEHLPLAATFLYRWSGYLGYLVRGHLTLLCVRGSMATGVDWRGGASSLLSRRDL